MPLQYCYPATAMRICIHQIQDARISGEIFCPLLEETISFTDMANLVLQMEDAFDQRGYPLAFQQKRSFRPGVRPPHSCPGQPDPQIVAERILEMQTKEGRLHTLVVYVVSRQNATWQGRIEWPAEGVTEPFRSALEFIHQVDAHLVKKEALPPSPRQAI